MEPRPQDLSMPHLLAGIPREQHETARAAIIQYLTIVRRIYERAARDSAQRGVIRALTNEEPSGTLDTGHSH